MGASFRFITQPKEESSVVHAWNKACRTALLTADGSVRVERTVVNTTYLWEILSQPTLSNVTLTPVEGYPHIISIGNISKLGGYIIRLTVDAALPTKDVMTLYFGVPLPNSGLCIPAFNETLQDNTETTPGYQSKLDAFFVWCDANAGGGGSVGIPFDVILLGSVPYTVTLVELEPLPLSSSPQYMALIYTLKYTLCPLDTDVSGGHVITGEVVHVITMLAGAYSGADLKRISNSVYVPVSTLEDAQDPRPVFDIHFEYTDSGGNRCPTLVLSYGTDELLKDSRLIGTVQSQYIYGPVGQE